MKMLDLDRLLMQDAAQFNDATSETASLDATLEAAHTAIRRRRVVTAGAMLAAAAVVTGGVVTAGVVASTGAKDGAGDRKPAIRLAAYDHVLGPVRGQPDQILVVGPLDDHTANCQVVPGSAVRLPDSTGSLSVKIPRSVFRPDDVVHLDFSLRDAPPGPYYVFTCPAD